MGLVDETDMEVERYSLDTSTWDVFQLLTHPCAWPAACVYIRARFM